MDGWAGGWVDEWMSGWMGGWMDGWISRGSSRTERIQEQRSTGGHRGLGLRLCLYLKLQLVLAECVYWGLDWGLLKTSELPVGLPLTACACASMSFRLRAVPAEQGEEEKSWRAWAASLSLLLCLRPLPHPPPTLVPLHPLSLQGPPACTPPLPPHWGL